MINYIKTFVFTCIASLNFSCTDTNNSTINSDPLNEQITVQEIKTVTVDQLSESMLSSHLVIDVRELSELKAGIIPGSVHIPMNSIGDKLPEYLQASFKNTNSDDWKNKPILLYCAGGIRSYKSAETLQKLGFSNLKSLDGGFNAYKTKNN